MSLTAVSSPHSVSATTDRLAAALDVRGITLFARIEHSGLARAAGLELAGEEVLIFGDPRVGTALMQSDPEIGYELPLRVLIRDAGGRTMVGYRAPTEMASAYAVADQAAVLGRMNGLLESLIAQALAPG